MASIIVIFIRENPSISFKRVNNYTNIKMLKLKVLDKNRTDLLK